MDTAVRRDDTERDGATRAVPPMHAPAGWSSPNRGKVITNLVRNHSIASLAVMTLAAVVMFAVYRSILIGAIETIAETNSVAAARLALHPIRAQLASYVEAANESGKSLGDLRLPESLHEAIAELMRDSRVVRVKIYNRDGTVIFSTRREQIGDPQESNPGFATAISGKVSVQIVYRDTFNAFDRATEEDNLVQAYLPVRGRDSKSVVGVFETYTDVNALVIEAERSEFLLVVGTVLAFACIYAVQFVVVRRSQDQVEAHRKVIAEQSALLQYLSGESMRREESERRKFALELHEGLAQSLSAVKLALEDARGGPGAVRAEALSSVIPDLQSAIGHARAIAMHMHPPGLRELGLGPSVRALCRKFAGEHPLVEVEQEIDVDESPVPALLTTCAYRILEAMLSAVGSRPEVTWVRITMRAGSGELTLLFEDNAAVVVTAIRDKDTTPDPRSLFSVVGERVLISKGNLTIIDSAAGTPVLRASWSL